MKSALIAFGMVSLMGLAGAQAADESATAPAAVPKTLKVYCLFQKAGADRLTQKEFDLKDLATVSIFEDSGLHYYATYEADADAYTPGMSALSVRVVDPKSKADFQSRSLFPASSEVAQARLDGTPVSKGKPHTFVLCDTRQVP